MLRDSLPVVHSTGVVWGSWGPCLVKSTIGFFGTAVAAVAAAVAVGVDVTATVAVLSMSVLSSFSGWMVCFCCILTLDRRWTLVTSRTVICYDLLLGCEIHINFISLQQTKINLTWTYVVNLYLALSITWKRTATYKGAHSHRVNKYNGLQWTQGTLVRSGHRAVQGFVLWPRDGRPHLLIVHHYPCQPCIRRRQTWRVNGPSSCCSLSRLVEKNTGFPDASFNNQGVLQWLLSMANSQHIMQEKIKVRHQQSPTSLLKPL